MRLEELWERREINGSQEGERKKRNSIQPRLLRRRITGVVRMVGAACNGAVSIDYQCNTTGCLPFSPTDLDP